MKHKELTEKIIKIYYKVYNALGYGFLEKIYENAMMIEFRKTAILAVSQSPIEVIYNDEIIGDYFADIVVEDRLILELKAATALQKIHEAQLLNYMKACNFKIGMLVNFTYPKAEIIRFIL